MENHIPMSRIDIKPNT